MSHQITEWAVGLKKEEEECQPEVSFFQWPDYVVCGLMLLVSAAIGIFFGVQARRKKATTDDILMGGRKMHTFPMAMSLLARYIYYFILYL